MRRESINDIGTRIKNRYQTFGLLGLLRLIIYRILRPVIKYENIFLYERNLAELRPFKAKIDVSYHVWEKEDLPNIRKYLEDINAVDRHRAISKVEHGQFLIAGIHKDHLACYAIFDISALTIGSLRINLPDKTAYSSQNYTVPKYRRLGLNTEMLFYLFSFLKQRGYYRCYSCILSYNSPSIRGHLNLGFKKIGRFKHICFLGRYWLLFYSSNLIDRLWN